VDFTAARRAPSESGHPPEPGVAGEPLGSLLDRDQVLVLAADAKRGLAVRGR
jgi:hypothetical protein